MKKLDWYLKWVATAILIAGTGINGLGFFPLGPIVLTVGGLLWLVVSIMWREPSLIVTNGIMTVTGIGTLCYSIFFKG